MRNPKMNKAELISKVAETTGMTKVDADKAVDAVFSAITSALKSGDDVRLIGFGAFSVSNRAARQGKNPMTGAAITIPASKAPKFSAGKALKDTING
ncbi:HU family DNA-binding protein [Magnetospirillum sp. 15-1]|uniref:HU family DNA-binding protein n=1 Tax=Magnetospirillum sp. 15-1 TaxID=1979370 RepID=UPI002413281B|nr:HU family DNA-binding protein [Magnetospirillum sp. 15-1]